MSMGEPSRQPSPPASSPAEIFLKIGRAVVWVLYAIVVINAVILSLAFLLRLLGANPDAGFTEWVYRSASRSMNPFRGIFPDRQVGDASVLDTSLLFAAIVYIVVAMLIDGVLRWLGHRLVEQQNRTLREQAAADADARQRAAGTYGAPARPGEASVYGTDPVTGAPLSRPQPPDAWGRPPSG